MTEESNPFSFKKFLKRASEGGGGPEAEGRRQKGRRGGRVASEGDGRGRKSGLTGEEGLPFPEAEEPAATGGTDDNPFSFKKFVQRSGDKMSARPPTLTGSDEEELPFPGLAGDKAPPVPPPVAEQGQNRLKDSRVKKKAKEKLQDSLFTDSEESDDSFEEISVPSSLPLPVSHGLSDGEVGTALMSDPLGVLQPGVGEPVRPVLVDRLQASGVRLVAEAESSSSDSDSHVTPGGGRLGLFRDISSAKPSGRGTDGIDLLGSAHLIKELKELKSENERLMEELKKSQEQTRQERERNKSLKEKIKALRKKEAEETKALEEVVQRVEENLVSTTKRATAAEATITKLKQEIQSLQAQLSLASPQSVHQHYEEMLAGVREKASFASQNLFAAATKADQSIRELVSGVDTLRNVAEVLDFIDRISEIKPS